MTPSETVRAIFKEFGMIDAEKVKEIAKSRGVDVSTSLIYTTKSRLKVVDGKVYEKATRLSVVRDGVHQIMSFTELLAKANMEGDYVVVFEAR